MSDESAAPEEPFIHPTAVVDPSTQLGTGVHIGPYCVIHPGVTLGDGCHLQNHVTVAGPSTIGKNNRFFAYASIGQQTQDLKYAGEPTSLEIGDGNTFREFVTLNRSTTAETVTRIGSNGNFLAYTHIGHDCIVGDGVIFSNNATLGGHVEIGNNVILGGITGIHQFCRIGDHAITGGHTKIVQDVPPFMIADGNPATLRGINTTGLQRHHFDPEEIRALKNAYKKLFLDRTKNLANAIEEFRALGAPAPIANRLLDFLEASSRGSVR